jgi:hypothetical protein
MISWDSLDLTEQMLLAGAVRRIHLAGAVARLGQMRRWAGVRDAAALRSYTEAEEREVSVEVSAAALDLADRGILLVRDQRGLGYQGVGPVLPPEEARAVLADPERWLWISPSVRDFDLDTPEDVREQLMDHAWPVADVRMPSWGELTDDEQEILICATELSGYLTGPYGIWSDPPADLDTAERRAWVGEQLAPLLPFVREGWLEVRHVWDHVDFHYTVVPLEQLLDAFSDLELRYQGDEWGVGFTCVYTLAGYAARPRHGDA